MFARVCPCMRVLPGTLFASSSRHGPAHQTWIQLMLFRLLDCRTMASFEEDMLSEARFVLHHAQLSLMQPTPWFDEKRKEFQIISGTFIRDAAAGCRPTSPFAFFVDATGLLHTVDVEGTCKLRDRLVLLHKALVVGVKVVLLVVLL